MSTHTLTCSANVRLSFTLYIKREGTHHPRLRVRQREAREKHCHERTEKQDAQSTIGKEACSKECRAGSSQNQVHKATRHEKHRTKLKHASAFLGRRNAGFDGEKRKNARTQCLGNPSGSAFFQKKGFTCKPLLLSRRGVRAQFARRAGETHKKAKPATSGPFRGINSFPRTWPRSVRFHGRFCRKRRASHDSGSLFGQKPPDT